MTAAVPKVHRVTLPTSRFTWCSREQNWTTIRATTDPAAVTCLPCLTTRVVIPTPRPTNIRDDAGRRGAANLTPALAAYGWEADGGHACENCWRTGRAAVVREDARSGRWLCRHCEPNPTADGLRRLPNGGLGEPRSDYLEGPSRHGVASLSADRTWCGRSAFEVHLRGTNPDRVTCRPCLAAVR